MSSKIKTIGLTGGIGSGKSTIAKMFEELGVSVYVSDIEAKKLMVADQKLISAIKELLGDLAYINNELNRNYIAKKVFNDKKLLQKLNQIVHPAVAKHFEEWRQKQKGEYVIKEAAILFENEGYKECDYVILVTAPEDTRIKRVMKRDNVSKEQVLARLKNQWSDQKKINLANEVVINEDIEKTRQKVLEIHNKLYGF